jgi:hypothetical protein
MDEMNVEPSHNKCPHCGLACQNISAQASSPRDERGRSLPFPPAFKAQKQAELAAKGRRPAPFAGKRANPGKTAGPRPGPVGREWLGRYSNP